MPDSDVALYLNRRLWPYPEEVAAMPEFHSDFSMPIGYAESRNIVFLSGMIQPDDDDMETTILIARLLLGLIFLP